MAIKIQGTDVIDDNRDLVNVPNLPQDIEKPQPVSPADNATDIGEEPTLDGGTYYSLYGFDHQFSRFQVSDDDQFSNIVYDSGEISGTETHTVPAGNLQEGQVTYYWRVYYKDSNGFQSEYSDAFEFTTTNEFFDPADPSNIGGAFAGGYLVGVIDTVAGTIDSQDDYQTGERYALVVAPKSLETGGLKWDSQDRTGEAGSFTRWDGLSSTDSILAKNDTSYEAFEHIRSIRSSDPVPSDGGSDWYLPAMDELELIYRNLKPIAADNSITSDTRAFPGTQQSGFNPSSDPTSSAYTVGDPSQTSLVEFQDGGAEAVDSDRYFTSTDADEFDFNTNRIWIHYFGESGVHGKQNAFAGKPQDFYFIRPVRRVPL